ncbi:DNA repair protein RAD51-like 3 [Symbiodinium microadriaticum]|uniref:DNA repair protein RAD51-like 3 n=1 Tax=Symbiodinium microadriaticum TaxID=2951 RepID=A0A1Q9CBH2_SYMMI|nr:DNA repair protein RAD51-like 3 [Symbiodinium microadriaticum]
MAYRSPLVLCLAAAAVLLIAPQAFVPSPKSQTAGAALAAGAAAGSMAVPVWAYDQQVMDAQMLLARIPGGKRTQELGLVIPMAEEDGLTDGQVAGLFLIALVVFISAIDLAKTMYNGINPAKFKTSKGKGYISPLVKRYIENGLNGLLGSALQGGGALLEVCGLPGSGKTQFCLQLCAAAQISPGLAEPDSLAEAIYVDTEGSFVPERYMQVCEALLSETRPTLDASSVCRLLEAGMRRLHVCRAYDATELYSTIKRLGSFIQGRPRIRALVVDSIAFSFRHELMDNTAQRARIGLCQCRHCITSSGIGHAAFDLGSAQSTPTSSLVGLAPGTQRACRGSCSHGSWASRTALVKNSVASTCATDFEATTALPRSVLEPHWSADFESFCWQSIPLIDPARFSLDHLIRPSCEGLHAQIEVHMDHALAKKVVAKRFTRAYLRDSPSAFRESDAFCGEDPWTEMFLAMKLGQAGPDRIKGVLPCYGVYRDASDSALLIMEWASGGDVFEFASSLGEPGPAREAQAAQVLCALLQTVSRLHSLGIAHGDVSAENAILRVENGEVEVALLDFAMAIHDTDLSSVTGARGKPMYRAPETLQENVPYDARAADLFACGVVGYALAIGNYPWQSTAGGCKAFSYVQKNGLARFFEKFLLAN